MSENSFVFDMLWLEIASYHNISSVSVHSCDSLPRVSEILIQERDEKKTVLFIFIRKS